MATAEDTLYHAIIGGLDTGKKALQALGVVEVKRFIIAGGPNTGKTTAAKALAKEHGIKTVRNTDELLELGWSEASKAVADWMSEPGDWIIEGVVTPRAMRKWMVENPNKAFAKNTQVLLLTEPFKPQSKGQMSMAKGAMTVYGEIEKELKKRGAHCLKGSTKSVDGEMSELDKELALWLELSTCLKYAPGQPRDKQGQFAPVGGGGGSAIDDSDREDAAEILESQANGGVDLDRAEVARLLEDSGGFSSSAAVDLAKELRPDEKKVEVKEGKVTELKNGGVIGDEKAVNGWSKDSFYKDPVYHYSESKDKIEQDGFRLRSNDSYGDGIYFAMDKDFSADFAGAGSAATPITAKLKVSRENYIHFSDMTAGQKTNYQAWIKKNGEEPGISEGTLGRFMNKHGYKVWNDGTQLGVMDPKAIGIIKAPTKKSVEDEIYGEISQKV